MTDASLATLSEHSPGLEVLSLQGCERITDNGCIRLFRRCRNIAKLNLKAVPDLTEVGICTLDSVQKIVIRVHRQRFVSYTSFSCASEKFLAVAHWLPLEPPCTCGDFRYDKVHCSLQEME